MEKHLKVPHMIGIFNQVIKEIVCVCVSINMGSGDLIGMDKKRPKTGLEKNTFSNPNPGFT